MILFLSQTKCLRLAVWRKRQAKGLFSQSFSNGPVNKYAYSNEALYRQIQNFIDLHNLLFPPYFHS